MNKIKGYLILVLLIGCAGRHSSDNETTQAIDTARETAEHYNRRKREEALAKKKEASKPRNEEPVYGSGNKWYEGGTLHRSKIGEWKRATEANKLATCADFVAKMSKAPSMDVLLARATDLRACINEATRGLGKADTENVSDVAAMCGVLLGY